MYKLKPNKNKPFLNSHTHANYESVRFDLNEGARSFEMVKT